MPSITNYVRNKGCKYLNKFKNFLLREIGSDLGLGSQEISECI